MTVFTVRLIKAERLRRMLVLLFYGAYAVAMGYCLVHAANQSDQFLYGFLLLFVPFGLLYELVRYYFGKSSDALNRQCDPALALRCLGVVRRADLLSRYRTQAGHLEGLALLDQDRVGEAQTLIETRLDKLLGTNTSLHFEYNYLCFSVAAVCGDKEKLQDCHAALKKIIGLKQKPGADLVSLFNCIDGIFHLQCRAYDAAEEAFDRVQLEALSTREQARCFYYRAVLCARQKAPEASQQLYERALALAPEIALFQNHKP